MNCHQTLPFDRNGHGHFVIEVTGLSLTGQEEIARSAARDSARDVLSTAEYDLKHYLKDREAYRVALIHWGELKVAAFRERTNANYLRYGEGFGYRQPRAGLQPRLHEILAGEMGMHEQYYCAALHQPIMVEGRPTLLYSRQYPDGWQLTTDSGIPSHEWHDPGFFAYEIPG